MQYVLFIITVESHQNHFFLDETCFTDLPNDGCVLLGDGLPYTLESITDVKGSDQWHKVENTDNYTEIALYHKFSEDDYKPYKFAQLKEKKEKYHAAKDKEWALKDYPKY